MNNYKKNIAIILGSLTILSFIMIFICAFIIEKHAIMAMSITFILASLFVVVLEDTKTIVVRYLFAPIIMLFALYYMGVFYYPDFNYLILELLFSYLIIYIVYSLANNKELSKIFASRQSGLWKVTILILILSVCIFTFLIPHVSNILAFYIGIFLLIVSILILYVYKKMSVYYNKKRMKNFDVILTLLINFNSYVIMVLSTYLIIKYVPYVYSGIRELSSFVQDDKLRANSHIVRYAILEALFYIYIFTIQFRYEKKGN